MSDKKGPVAALKQFGADVNQELHRCTWPAWPELRGSTIVVILSVLLLSGLVALADQVFRLLLQLVAS